MILQFPFLPPSVNQCYYTDFTNRTRHKSKKYREFMRNCESYMYNVETFDCDIQIEYNFYFPDKRKRDAENYLKACSDMLVHYGVIKDDSLIVRGVYEKYYQKGKPETVIEIIRKA